MSTNNATVASVTEAINAEIKACPAGIRIALIHHLGAIDEDRIKSYIDGHIAYLQTEECLRGAVMYGWMPEINWENEPFGKPLWRWANVWDGMPHGVCDASCKICVSWRAACTCADCKK